MTFFLLSYTFYYNAPLLVYCNAFNGVYIYEALFCYIISSKLYVLHPNFYVCILHLVRVCHTNIFFVISLSNSLFNYFLFLAKKSTFPLFPFTSYYSFLFLIILINFSQNLRDIFFWNFVSIWGLSSIFINVFFINYIFSRVWMII